MDKRTTVANVGWLCNLVGTSQSKRRHHPIIEKTNLAIIENGVVIEDRAGSGTLSLHVGDLIPIQSYAFLQQTLDLAPSAEREVGDGMRLVEDSTNVLSVRRKMVRHGATDLEMSTDLKNLVQHVIQCADAHMLLELMDLFRD